MRFLGNDVSNLRLVDCSLRMFVVPLSVASIWLTVTNQQDNNIYGKVEYSNFIGLKYMVCISAISAGYAIFAVASSWVRCLMTKTWLFFVSDQVFTSTRSSYIQLIEPSFQMLNDTFIYLNLVFNESFAIW
ncbi:CASP 2D1 [Olea europaea subsp. europaea]|uniref:CASP-like protein n=1 Tax=Olea europaea subsp. europaea TaxID=158383 RepID=A0A8S0TK13_OLEEU|nr:CASP 2D1 [Olea europaea subsp. europaea]